MLRDIQRDDHLFHIKNTYLDIIYLIVYFHMENI